MDGSQLTIIVTYATIASVFVAFILVLITAWYAWQTRRMVEEMKKGRINSILPIIVYDVEMYFDPNRDGVFNNIIVRNVGNSPAIDTSLDLLLTNPETSYIKIESQHWFLGTVSLNNHRTIEIKPFTDINIPSPDAYPTIEINCSYKNTYGILLKTTSKFSLQKISQDKIKGYIAPYNWVKLEENVISSQDLTHQKQPNKTLANRKVN